MDKLANLRPYTKEHPGMRHTQKGPYLLPLLKKFLNKKISFEDPETQKVIKGRVKDAIVWRLILNATQGENDAIKEIFNRLDGKVAEVVIQKDDSVLLNEEIEIVPGNGNSKKVLSRVQHFINN